MARPFSLHLLLLLLLLGALLVSARAPRLKRNGTRSATRTTSAASVKARQVTRERILGRADKLVMANLFGREDCSIPQPSTGACTCGQPYALCGPSHPIPVPSLRLLLASDLESKVLNASTKSVDNCGGCDQGCTGANPGCCGGVCSDFDSTATCGGCDNPCEGGEACCDGSCVLLSGNHDNCGACGNPCDEEELCCNGECIPQDNDNCGVCGSGCFVGDICCGGQCFEPGFDDEHCGDCTTQCFFPYTCFFGGCENFERRRELLPVGEGSGLK